MRLRPMPSGFLTVFLILALTSITGCAPRNGGAGSEIESENSGIPSQTGSQSPSQPDAGSAPASSAGNPTPSSPDLSQVLHRGIDVSVHSGEVAWPEVADAGHSYAFVKATEGVDLLDGAFETHWPAMKSAGVIRGAYHFYVTEDDPLDQAQFFIETVHLEAGDLVPVVDVEVIGHNTQPGLADRLQRFLDRIEEHYGVRPMIYTAPNFWDEHLDEGFGRYPLWIAEYEVDQPRLPKGWESWSLWQWQADAPVPGVANGADLSHLNPVHRDLGHLVIPDSP